MAAGDVNGTARLPFTGLPVPFIGLLSLALLVVGFALLFSPPSSAQSVQMKTKVLRWSGHGLKLELQALPLDRVKAFFLARGFGRKDASYLAQTGCLFRSSIGNGAEKTGGPAVTIELRKWQILHDGTVTSPRTREEWEPVWKRKKVSDIARTAFYWALFPTKQTYQASDYNWGMISFFLSPKTKFDLEVLWQQAGTPQRHLFKNLECGK